MHNCNTVLIVAMPLNLTGLQIHSYTLITLSMRFFLHSIQIEFKIVTLKGDGYVKLPIRMWFEKTKI